jgi:hypothetical protein
MTDCIRARRICIFPIDGITILERFEKRIGVTATIVNAPTTKLRVPVR